MKTLTRISIIFCIAVALSNKLYSQQLVKSFCTAMLIDEHQNQGVAAFLGYTMMRVNNDSWTGIVSQINEIETNVRTQQRFLYYLFRDSPNKAKLKYALYFLCGNDLLASQVSSYCYKTFINAPKSAQDLKVKFDRIDIENRRKVAQEKEEAEKRRLDSIAIEKYNKRFEDSLKAAGKQLY